MDAAGKDGTIKHVMTGVNPQGVQVFAFKAPSPEELDHNFLWRYMRRCRSAGGSASSTARTTKTCWSCACIRSCSRSRSSAGQARPGVLKDRYEDINTFERHLVRNGTLIVKFFLNVSKKEQKKRFLERLENEEKNWKFSTADLAERGHWDEYTEAFEDMLGATSTDWAPWYVVPADNKWVTRAVVADILTSSIRDLGLDAPQVTKEKKRELAQPESNCCRSESSGPRSRSAAGARGRAHLRDGTRTGAAAGSARVARTRVQ
jgi:PPK2 family polyphosphate:nucleotide phosphotransferase